MKTLTHLLFKGALSLLLLLTISHCRVQKHLPLVDRTNMPTHVTDTLKLEHYALTIQPVFWENAMPSADEHQDTIPKIYLFLTLVDLNGMNIHGEFRLDSVVKKTNTVYKSWAIEKNPNITSGPRWEAVTLKTGLDLEQQDVIDVYGTDVNRNSKIKFRLKLPHKSIAY